MKYSIIATWNMSLNGTKIAKKMLDEGKSETEAILAGVNDVENNPQFHSVGYGGLPNIDGIVSCDGAFMNGDTLKFGAVGDVTDIRNVVNIAELLSHEEKNNFLVSKGAQLYALRHGFEKQLLLTKEAKKIYNDALKELKTNVPYHDTVCFIIMKDGHMVAATSTSGLFMKEKGRLGDTPICGSGFYVDSEIGGCCATGMGEDIARGVLSYQCVALMEQGCSVKDAAEKALKDFEKKLKGTCREISLIAMDKDGNTAVASNTDFAYVTASDTAQADCYRVDITSSGKTVD